MNISEFEPLSLKLTVELITYSNETFVRINRTSLLCASYATTSAWITHGLMQLLTGLLYAVSTYSSDDPRGEYLLLQPEHRKPVVLHLVHVHTFTTSS